MSWTFLIAFLLLELPDLPQEVPVELIPGLELSTGAAVEPKKEVEDLSAKLRWHNLEVISGELSEATATATTFRSPWPHLTPRK